MSFTRSDIKEFMKQISAPANQELLTECGCEDEDYSINSKDMYKPQFNPMQVHDQVLRLNGSDSANCPMSYGKTAELAGNDPHSVLEVLRPLMQSAGVGCPQSFAKALADVFAVTQDMGIVKAFNTEEI